MINHKIKQSLLSFTQLYSKIKKTKTTIVFAGTFLAFTTIAQANPLLIGSNLLHKAIDVTVYPLLSGYPVTQFHYNKIKMAYLNYTDDLELRDHLDENPFSQNEMNETNQVSVTGEIKDCSYLSNTDNKYEAVLLRGKCINGVQVLNRFSSDEDRMKLTIAQEQGFYAKVKFYSFDTKFGQPRIDTVKIASDLISVPTIKGTNCRPVTFKLDHKACKTLLAGKIISTSVLNEEQTLVMKVDSKKLFFNEWFEAREGSFFKKW